MNDPLKPLTVLRETRRDSAVARLTEAQAACDKAHALCQSAFEQMEESRHWQADLLHQCALGAGQNIRESVLPACEALLEQRLQAFVQTQLALRAAMEQVAAKRQSLMRCERELLRIDEWKTVRQVQERQHAALQENRQDDEWMTRQPMRQGVG